VAVGGIDATHDEMLRKVQEASALNEAKMEMALSNVDSQGAKIEEDAQAIQAAELVKQFKLEMGVTPTEVSPEAIPTKTIGRNSVQV
jgi:phage shock protein A